MGRQQPAARRPTPRSLATGATLPVTFWRGGARGNIRARILWKFREDTEWTAAARCNFRIAKPCFTRSQEHTSELQSLMLMSYAVFCLKQKITGKQMILIPLC